MTDHDSPQSHELFQQAMAAYQAAHWEQAWQLLETLVAQGNAPAEAEELLAELRLKLSAASAASVRARPAPRPPVPPRMWLGAALGVLAVVSAAIVSWQVLTAPRPEAAAAAFVVVPTLPPTALPATATTVPTTASTPISTATPLLEPGALTVQWVAGQELTVQTRNLEIILDASGSMLQVEGDRRRYELAHEALETLVGTLPDGTNVALRAYGHTGTGSCGDLDLVVPLSPLDRAAMVSRIRSIQPQPNALTPIGLALQQVPVDLGGITGATHIVLVTDGEDTCDGDPVAAAAALRAQNPRLRVSVIGFRIESAEGRAQLQAIAEQGGGLYLDAGDASQLATALQQFVTLNYRVLDASGSQVFSGLLGTTTTILPAGLYRVEIDSEPPVVLDAVQVGGAPVLVELRVRDGTLEALLPGAAP